VTRRSIVTISTRYLANLRLSSSFEPQPADHLLFCFPQQQLKLASAAIGTLYDRYTALRQFNGSCIARGPRLLFPSLSPDLRVDHDLLRVQQGGLYES